MAYRSPSMRQEAEPLSGRMPASRVRDMGRGSMTRRDQGGGRASDTGLMHKSRDSIDQWPSKQPVPSGQPRLSACSSEGGPVRGHYYDIDSQGSRGTEWHRIGSNPSSAAESVLYRVSGTETHRCTDIPLSPGDSGNHPLNFQKRSPITTGRGTDDGLSLQHSGERIPPLSPDRSAHNPGDVCTTSFINKGMRMPRAAGAPLPVKMLHGLERQTEERLQTVFGHVPSDRASCENSSSAWKVADEGARPKLAFVSLDGKARTRYQQPAQAQQDEGVGGMRHRLSAAAGHVELTPTTILSVQSLQDEGRPVMKRKPSSGLSVEDQRTSAPPRDAKAEADALALHGVAIMRAFTKSISAQDRTRGPNAS
eukprot:gene6611-3264_t